MANTYDPNLSTDKDIIRWYIGDVSSPWIMSDEEITATITRTGGTALDAAITVCTALIARFARKSTGASVGPFSIDYSVTVDQFRSLLASLEAERSRNQRATPYLSGVDLDQEEDLDKKPFLFDKGMDDNLYQNTYEGSRSPTGWPQ